MERIGYLQEHLATLTGMENSMGGYAEQIAATLSEIEKELGVAGPNTLSSYSTAELHEELSKRDSVDELAVDFEQEVTVEVVTGDIGRVSYYKGPIRILVNRD